MTLQEQEIQDQNKNDQLLEAAKQLLSAAGIDANAFDTAINAIQTAKDQSSSIVNPKNKNYLDKTFIYEDVDTFIYKRGDTKGIWYFRIWDTNKKKQYSDHSEQQIRLLLFIQTPILLLKTDQQSIHSYTC